MQSGIFPERLKYSIIEPLYKKGHKQLISNYRPVSLLTSFSKVVEKVMFNRLINHLNKYAILNPSQYGFQKNLTMDNAVYALLLTEVSTALNNKSRVKVIFCDIEKAFDCVNHDVLLHKLEMYGVTGTTKELFSQFLSNRYERVKLKDKLGGQTLTSNWSKIKHWVPQVSVLGPLLFLLYINDYPLAINKSSTPILFADDTSLVITDRNPDNIDAKLNIHLQIVHKWFKSKLLSINVLKTHCMQFKTKNTVSTDTILVCNNNVITEVSNIKFLGLIMDDTLSWNLNIDKVMKRLTSVCYMIRAVKPYMSFSSLIMICKKELFV
jgi:hypothetical protein